MKALLLTFTEYIYWFCSIITFPRDVSLSTGFFLFTSQYYLIIPVGTEQTDMKIFYTLRKG